MHDYKKLIRLKLINYFLVSWSSESDMDLSVSLKHERTLDQRFSFKKFSLPEQFESSFDFVFLERGKLKLDPHDVGNIFGSEMLIDRVPAVKRLKESVQVDWFLEADHNSESWGEFFHRTFGMS